MVERLMANGYWLKGKIAQEGDFFVKFMLQKEKKFAYIDNFV